MQPQGHFQVLVAMIDDDLNPQDALDRPRWLSRTAGQATARCRSKKASRSATMARLAELGHTVQPVSGRGAASFGDGQIIRRDPESGVLFGGSDPRKDGLVAAF